MDLRCEFKKHGELIDDRFVEFKCNSGFCGARKGVVVIHKFDLHNGGKLVATRKFREPPKEG